MNEEIEDDFKYLCIFNVPWITQTLNGAPLQKVDDGTNDITLMKGSKSRSQLAKVLIKQDAGDYFLPTEKEEVDPNLGLEYYKSTQWSLKPQEKGETNFYAIDGEKYRAQDVEGKVLKQVLGIYSF